jgi:hypothetical protein
MISKEIKNKIKSKIIETIEEEVDNITLWDLIRYHNFSLPGDIGDTEETEKYVEEIKNQICIFIKSNE